MYTGKTQNLAVIGWPIAHSLSPVIQNSALNAAGLDYAYIALPIAPADLGVAVSGLRAARFRGWNVTIPHKTAIIEYLDEIDAAAAAIGAVNTVVNDAGKLIGYNTDAIGFIEPLKTRLAARGADLSGKNCVVIGAGGAARALLYALIAENAATITLAVRSAVKGLPLAEEFSAIAAKMGKATKISVADTADGTSGEKSYRAALQSTDIVVNATPLGMTPHIGGCPPVIWDALKADAFCYDIIYTPAETVFLKTARERGNETLNGEEMLVGQARAALKLWTGSAGDKEIMLDALRRALQ